MDWYAFLIIAHVIGTALGVGGATVADFLFLGAIKDVKIEKGELSLLKIVSSVIWLGFLILVFSGFGFLILYRLTKPELGLIYDPKLWAKLSVVSVILLNGLIMHWKVFPLFESYLGRPLNSPEFIKKVSVAFTTGAISIISWYAALILGAWRGLNLGFFTILAVYLVVVFIGILIANSVGRRLLR